MHHVEMRVIAKKKKKKNSDSTENSSFCPSKVMYGWYSKIKIIYLLFLGIKCNFWHAGLLHIEFSMTDQWFLWLSNSNYQNLLETHNELTIHQRKLQVLMTQIYKIVNYVAPPIMNSPFDFRSNEYNIRNFQVLSTSEEQ